MGFLEICAVLPRTGVIRGFPPIRSGVVLRTLCALGNDRPYWFGEVRVLT